MIENHAFVFWGLAALAGVFALAVVALLILIAERLERIETALGWVRVELMKGK